MILVDEARPGGSNDSKHDPAPGKIHYLFLRTYSCGIAASVVLLPRAAMFIFLTHTLRALHWRTAPLFANVDIDPSFKVCLRPSASFPLLDIILCQYIRFPSNITVLASLAIGMAGR